MSLCCVGEGDTDEIHLDTASMLLRRDEKEMASNPAIFPLIRHQIVWEV